ncbi:glycosyltransferase family 2 protein [Pontiella agarivorans]|uniref:Glycosyltransferase family 2 protein n=1 Tax=Pontiella agarivorans TaxID=3038953 RepID=A0ABU5MUE0_9BACT|nr:glycosyltransferase family 2 protein [Pontiella agarivorans]MDZ8117748.1 glycosyltransferase family 2 protein [Pontiella agarivorans]
MNTGNTAAVSIYVITYMTSEQRYPVLRHTVECALRQDYPEFEVVVSDNCSPVSVHEALKGIDDPRLRICTNGENTGFAGNLNRCVEHCAHDIIKPLCDDDLLHPGFLSATVPLIDDETMVVAGVEKFLVGNDPEGLKKSLPETLPTVRRDAGYGTDIWKLPFSASSIPSATIYSRRLFEELGGYDAKTITADWDLFIEACIHRRVVAVDTTLCYVGVWGGSLTEEMLDKPYFFPQQGLYTKFRVARCKQLLRQDQQFLFRMLRKELRVQGLRCLKNFYKRAYRDGYRDFYRIYRRLKHQRIEAFGARPGGIPEGSQAWSRQV